MNNQVWADEPKTCLVEPGLAVLPVGPEEELHGVVLNVGGGDHLVGHRLVARQLTLPPLQPVHQRQQQGQGFLHYTTGIVGTLIRIKHFFSQCGSGPGSREPNQCGSTRIRIQLIFSMRIRTRIQGAKPIRIHEDPDRTLGRLSSYKSWIFTWKIYLRYGTEGNRSRKHTYMVGGRVCSA